MTNLSYKPSGTRNAIQNSVKGFYEVCTPLVDSEIQAFIAATILIDVQQPDDSISCSLNVLSFIKNNSEDAV